MTNQKRKFTEVIVKPISHCGHIYLPKDWIGKKVKTVLLSLFVVLVLVTLMTSPTAALAKKHQPTQAVGTPSAGNDQPTSSPPTDDGTKPPADDGTKPPADDGTKPPADDGTKPPPVRQDKIIIPPTPTLTPYPIPPPPPPPIPVDKLPSNYRTNLQPPELVTLEDGSKQWQYTDETNTLLGLINNEWVKITDSSTGTRSTSDNGNTNDNNGNGGSDSSSGSGSTSDGTSGRHGSHSNSGSGKYSGLTQIPSVTTDFPGNDKNAIEVHVTSAKKDSIGSYHVRGEIKNLSNDTTLQFVKVTAHLNDETGQPVAVTTCCYADPNDIEPGHTSTFDSFAQEDEISGSPTSYRLSFDWR